MKSYMSLVSLTITLVAAAIVTSEVRDESLPAWLEAVSTLAAFTAAGFAVVQVSKTLAIERGRDHERERDQERAQARLVYGVQTGDPHRTPLGSVTSYVGMGRWKSINSGLMTPEKLQPDFWRARRDFWSMPVRLGNLSNELIYDVQVQVLCGGEVLDGTVHTLVSLDPGEVLRTNVFIPDLPTVTQPDADLRLEVWLSFHDSGGTLWVRDGYGPVRKAEHTRR